MNKYKFNRREIAKKLLTETYNYNQYGFSRKLVDELLATEEPESDKESKCECDCHERNDGYWCCLCKESHYRPGGVILTNDVKKFNTPQEELEVKPLKKTYFHSNEPMTDREEFVARGLEKHHDKIQELIKAHNALVKEVKELKRKPQGGISCGGEGFSNGGDFPIPNGR